MFGGDDEDRDFLSPSGGAKLASLFGLDQGGSQGNQSFQYTAPKQPRRSPNPASAPEKPPPPPGAPAVLFATAVQAFRYINGQYVKQGKLGAAALGNHMSREYKLLLYMNQQKQVTVARIHTGFIFTVQPNNYCTFYDDQRQNWSLMFDSDKALSDFCREVCLAKANSDAAPEAVAVQDVSVGDGQGVQHGDSVEVAYTGWLLQNHTVGQMFDSNQNKDKLLRLKIGAGKVIKGWEEGMLGMKKGGRRLLIIPPHLAYGSKGVPNRIPPASTLIFEVELRRVKFSKDGDSHHSSPTPRDSAAPSPAPAAENPTPEPAAQTTAQGPGRPGEPPLRAKSNSLSEQLANPDATKAKLISRMAKMGQPMLPFLTGVNSQPESSDSELEDTMGGGVKDPSLLQISTAAPVAVHAPSHPDTAPPPSLIPVMTSVAAQPALTGARHAFQPYSHTHPSVAPSQLQPVAPIYSAQSLPYMGSSDVTSFLMTEARQHSTEIRLAVGKVADKVDQLTSKIDDLQRHGSLSMGVSGMSMETSMVVNTIQRIVQENDCLKKDVLEKNSRIEEQNRKIGELINQNQRFMEQSNLLLEQRNDSLKSSSEQNHVRLLQAEQEKVRLVEDLASATARLAQLQLEASQQQQQGAELQGRLSAALQDAEGHSRRIAGLEAQLEESKETTERAQTQHRSERQRRKEVEARLAHAEEELLDLRADKELLERSLTEGRRKWQTDRQHWDQEVEELRRKNQQELDNMRDQLSRARSSTDSTAAEQVCQLEENWKNKCEQMLSSVRDRHQTETADLIEQRDVLQLQLQQLQDKFSAMEQQGVTVREKLEGKVSELEKKVSEQQSSGDTAAEVKRVMNGVFHSLRREFDLSESYSGRTVLSVIITTIKNATLQLLGDAPPSAPSRSEEEEEEQDGGGGGGGNDVTQGTVGIEAEETQEARTDPEVPEEEESGLKTDTDVPVGASGDRTEQEAAASASAAAAASASAQQEPLVDPHEKEPAQIPPPEAEAAPSGETTVENGEHTEATEAVSPKGFEPPTNAPPPPPVSPPESPPTGSGEEAVEEPCLGGVAAPLVEGPAETAATSSAAASAASAASASAAEEEEEDEPSLKGRPPPSPLFGDDDDDDVDWLH